MDVNPDAAMSDFSRDHGGAAIGALLRRLSERIDGEVARVYAALGVDFEQRWFGVLNQLVQNGPMSVGELAAALRITHVSVSQTRQSLEKANLIETNADPADARRRRLSLTPAGSALAQRLAPLWQAFDEAALELDAEAGGVAAILGRLDDALERRSLFDRITQRVS